MIPWRLESDMTLVAHEKKVMPFCAFLCNAVRTRGIGECVILDHELKNKTRAALCLALFFLKSSLKK